MNQSNKIKIWKTTVITTLLSVPALSSIISAIHLVKLFNLGNEAYLSYTLALVFELGAIASFLALRLIPSSINKWMVWSIFIMLAFLQIIGNVFYSYDFIYVAIQNQDTWLNSFNEFMGYFTGNDAKTNHMILSWIIGLPIPLIALFLLKVTPEFWETKKEDVTPKIETASLINNNEKITEGAVGHNGISNEGLTGIEGLLIKDESQPKIEEKKQNEVFIDKVSDDIKIKKENQYINKDNNLKSDKYTNVIAVNANPAIVQNNQQNVHTIS